MKIYSQSANEVIGQYLYNKMLRSALIKAWNKHKLQEDKIEKIIKVKNDN